MFDPVCGIEVDKGAAIEVTVDGTKYSFCSERCKADFKSDPVRFTELDPIIHLENVWKSYDLGKVKVEVLRNLSMRIHAGDLIALVGASGSGKSTAMNLLGSLDMPTKGSVRIGGRDVFTMSENELAEFRSQKIGFIFQQFNLIPSLSALDNVLLPKMMRGEADAKAVARGKELLRKVGLEKRMTHKPTELSGGEQQRVAIARAFINDPDIILADEPTGNLDSSTSTKIIALLVELWRTSNKTIVMITHDPHVAQHAQRILNMKDGQLICNGELAERSLWKKEHSHDDHQEE